MFRGNHPARIDEKGRLKVPAEFKRWIDEKHGSQFFITSKNGERAEIYPMKEWERIEEELINSPSGDEKDALLNWVNYYGQVVEMDSQGRLLIPQQLREKADLKGDVAVMGQQTKLIVMNEKRLLDKMESRPVTGADLNVLNIRSL